MFVLPGGLFVLKIHLVSEMAFQVAAEGGWALMVQGAPPQGCTSTLTGLTLPLPLPAAVLAMGTLSVLC